MVVVVCPLALCMALVVSAIGAGFAMVRQTDVYQLALERLQTDTQAQQALGEPIQPGWLVSGSINVNEDGGSADYAIPVSGPKASGMFYVKATKPEPGAAWQFNRLLLEINDTGQSIDLLAGR
jgi:hypothetical protein